MPEQVGRSNKGGPDGLGEATVDVGPLIGHVGIRGADGIAAHADFFDGTELFQQKIIEAAAWLTIDLVFPVNGHKAPGRPAIGLVQGFQNGCKLVGCIDRPCALIGDEGNRPPLFVQTIQCVGNGSEEDPVLFVLGPQTTRLRRDECAVYVEEVEAVGNGLFDRFVEYVLACD